MMIKIDKKNFNFYTILSILFLIAGIGIWLFWIIKYGVIYDIGIYSLAIVFIIPGILGFFLSLMDKKED
jgi:uncharacterized membrane protein (DUF373 family)